MMKRNETEVKLNIYQVVQMGIDLQYKQQRRGQKMAKKSRKKLIKL